MEQTTDSHKQYEELLVECFEKIIKLAPRKWEILKKEAKKAIGKDYLILTSLISTNSCRINWIILILWDFSLHSWVLKADTSLFQQPVNPHNILLLVLVNLVPNRILS